MDTKQKKKKSNRMDLASHREITDEMIIGDPTEFIFWISFGKLFIGRIKH